MREYEPFKIHPSPSHPSNAAHAPAPKVLWECGACGIKLTDAETLERDPNDNCCPACGQDELIYLLGENDG